MFSAQRKRALPSLVRAYGQKSLGRETGKALAIGVRLIRWFLYPAVDCGKYVFLERGDPEALCATLPRTIGMLSVPEDH